MKPRQKASSNKNRLLGAHVPDAVVDGVKVWVSMSPERNVSMFVREAIREKLRRDKIKFSDVHGKTTIT